MHSSARSLINAAVLTTISRCCSAFVLPLCSPSACLVKRTAQADLVESKLNVAHRGRLSWPTAPARARRQHSGARHSLAHGSIRGRLRMADGESDSSTVGSSEGTKEIRDPRLYSVRISRVTGIEWGTDLSFSWVYVRDLQPGGAADKCGEISKGDQLCAINDINTAGAPFDFAMDSMIGLEGLDVEFTFFKGTQAELKELVGAESPPEEITVTVLQKGKPEITLRAASGTNLRNLLTDNGINVYQSVTRWTNCKGKQLCGTCIVEINRGLENTTIRSLDESSTLRDNPDSYRLSCVTNMYDDVTVTVFPAVGAAQWTR